MEVSILKILITGMEEIKAEEHLFLMDAISYPYASQKDRNKLHKKWYRQAYPSQFEGKVLKTTDLELF